MWHFSMVPGGTEQVYDALRRFLGVGGAREDFQSYELYIERFVRRSGRAEWRPGVENLREELNTTGPVGAHRWE